MKISKILFQISVVIAFLCNVEHCLGMGSSSLISMDTVNTSAQDENNTLITMICDAQSKHATSELNRLAQKIEHINDAYLLLMKALHRKEDDAFVFIYASGARIPSQLQYKSLLLSIKQGCFRAMEILWEKMECEDDVLRYDVELLHTACFFNEIAIALFLIEKGINIESCNPKGDRALHYAIKNKFARESKNLVESKSINAEEISMNAEEISKKVALAHEKTLALVKILVERTCDINCYDDFAKRPLHIACYLNMPSVVACLIAAGADPNVRDAELYSPLHVAAQHGCVECIPLLLDAGARCDVLDKDEQTPLGQALQHAPAGKKMSIVEMLLNAGAQAPALSEMPLARLRELTEEVYVMLEAGAALTSADTITELYPDNKLLAALLNPHVSTENILEVLNGEDLQNNNDALYKAFVLIIGRGFVGEAGILFKMWNGWLPSYINDQQRLQRTCVWEEPFLRALTFSVARRDKASSKLLITLFGRACATPKYYQEKARLLRVAAMNSDYEMVKVLLSTGASTYELEKWVKSKTVETENPSATTSIYEKSRYEEFINTLNELRALFMRPRTDSRLSLLPLDVRETVICPMVATELFSVDGMKEDEERIKAEVAATSVLDDVLSGLF